MKANVFGLFFPNFFVEGSRCEASSQTLSGAKSRAVCLLSEKKMSAGYLRFSGVVREGCVVIGGRVSIARPYSLKRPENLRQSAGVYFRPPEL